MYQMVANMLQIIRIRNTTTMITFQQAEQLIIMDNTIVIAIKTIHHATQCSMNHVMRTSPVGALTFCRARHIC